MRGRKNRGIITILLLVIFVSGIISPTVTVYASRPLSLSTINEKLRTLEEKRVSMPHLNYSEEVSKFKNYLRESTPSADIRSVYDKLLNIPASSYLGKKTASAIIRSHESGPESGGPPETETGTETGNNEVDDENRNRVEVGDRNVDVAKLEELFKKYSDKSENNMSIFDKWEGSLSSDTEDGEVEGADFNSLVQKGKDKYSLQSDIAQMEANMLFTIVTSQLKNMANGDNTEYKKEIEHITKDMDDMSGQEDGKAKYNKEVNIKYEDRELEGKFDLSETLPIGRTYNIFTSAMLGNTKISRSEDDEDNEGGGTEEISSKDINNYVSFPGVFHKGVSSLFSEDSETSFSEAANNFISEYETLATPPGTIYGSPFSLKHKDSFKTFTVPSGADGLFTQEDPAKDILFQLRLILQYMISIPEEISSLAGETELVKSWLNENHQNYSKNMELYRDMIDIYDASGLESLASTLKLHADDQEKSMNELLELHGISTGEGEIESAIEMNKIFENPDYYELLAWTSAFTPFETDLNDYEMLMAHVSDGARDIYEANGIGVKRTPLKAVDRGTQVLTEVQSGNNIELTDMTLRQFIRQIETEDVMLFAQAMSTKELSLVNSASISETSDNDSPGELGESEVDNPPSGGNSKTVVSYNEITSSTTSNQYLGPVYFSSSDTNYEIDKMSKKILDNFRSESSEALLEEASAMVQGYDSNKYAREITPSAKLSMHLTESHGFINYMLMHNTLEEGSYQSTRVQRDLDKPLYIDFLGNIVTQSGVVVVPAFANTSLFTDISKYSFAHAMFLNSYPTLSSVKTSNIEMIEGDGEKYLIGLYPKRRKADTSNITGLLWGEPEQEGSSDESPRDIEDISANWNWRIMGVDSKGKFNKNWNIRKPGSTIYKSMKEIEPLKLQVEEGQSLEFFNPVTGIVDVGVSYAKNDPDEVKRSSKVFTFTEFDELSIMGEDYRSVVALNGVSTNPLTGDWLAMKMINYNHLLNEDHGLNVMSLVSLGHLYSILENCSDDMYAMSRFINSEDYIETMKGDKTLKTFAGIFENVSNFFLKSVKSNLLVYAPTLDNLPIIKSMSSWINIVGISFIVIALTMGILYLVLGFFRNEGVEVSKLVFIFLIVPLIISYTVRLHPSVIKYVFQDIPSRLLKNEVYVSVADEAESQYKMVNEYMFIDKKLSRESELNFKLQTLNEKEALEVRKYSDEGVGYTESPLYSVRHDHNTVNVLEDKVYLRGLDYYMDVYKLFEMSEVIDHQNFDYTFSMEHNTKYGYDMISPKTPFYHIMETLTHTVGTFTEGTSVAMRTIDYGHFTKSSGRSKAYFNSIFFIAPEKFPEFMLAYNEQQNRNMEDLIYNDAYEFTAEEITKFQEELEEMTPMAQKAMVFMIEKMGNLEDWLGINKILSRSDRMAPFEPEFIPLISTNDWYPDLIMYKDEEIDLKVEKINKRTKNFVLRELLPVMGHMSDENIIKTISLYASMEFNKEFSRSGRKIYPRELEAVSMSNHFLSRSLYMPKEEMFSSSSNSLSYYLANEGIGALILSIVDVTLRFSLYIIPLVAIILLGILPIFLVILFPSRHSELFTKLSSLTKITMLIAFMRFPIVIAYKLSYRATNLIGTTGGIIVSIVFTTILLMAMRTLKNIFLVNVANTTGYMKDRFNEQMSQVKGNQGGYGVTDRDLEPKYGNYTSGIYDSDNKNPMQDPPTGYQGGYGNTYVNSSYDNVTNSYINTEESRATYGRYNTDGTGWRDYENEGGIIGDTGIYSNSYSNIEGDVNIINTDSAGWDSVTGGDTEGLSLSEDDIQAAKDIDLILDSLADTEI